MSMSEKPQSKFRRWLRAAGTTPAQLARAAGYEQDTIHKWLSGVRKPSFEACRVLATVLKVDAIKIYDETHNPAKD